MLDGYHRYSFGCCRWLLLAAEEKADTRKRGKGMNKDDYILISTDDHVSEPPDVFVGRVPAKYVDDAPYVERTPEGWDRWVYNDHVIPNVGLNAVAGRPPDEYGMEPTSFDEMRDGCWDVHERVKDMSANGVLAGLNFPSFPRFAGQIFLESASKDAEMSLAMVRAYNDWHLEGWAGAYPDRFVPMGILPIWDPELCAAEVRRLAERGCHAISFTCNPYDLGLPSLHTHHWDPMLAVCEEVNTVVCMHLGSNSKAPMTSPDAPFTVQIVGTAIPLFHTATDLVWSHVCRDFPDIKFALSEGGIGWVPYWLERADYTYTHHKAWSGLDFGGQMPSDIFKRNIMTCYIDDKQGVENIDKMNADLVTWECDFPHSDSTWPESPEALENHFRGVDDAIVNKITHENVMKWFSFDPYPIRPRAKCTVGALRAEVPDHDISPVSVAERKTRPKARTFGDVIEHMSSWSDGGSFLRAGTT